jgi:hypothetical protein
MSNEFPEEQVDAMLQADAEHYIDDAEFTRRVLRNLPSRRRFSFRRIAIFAVALAGGVAVAARFLSGGAQASASELATWIDRMPVGPSLLIAVIIAVGVLAYEWVMDKAAP